MFYKVRVLAVAQNSSEKKYHMNLRDIIKVKRFEINNATKSLYSLENF